MHARCTDQSSLEPGAETGDCDGAREESRVEISGDRGARSDAEVTSRDYGL